MSGIFFISFITTACYTTTMAYSDFSLELLRERFGLDIVVADLFSTALPQPVPDFLHDQLQAAQYVVIGSDRSRSNWLISPVVMAMLWLNSYHFTVFSGEIMRGDPANELVGECDFLFVLPANAATIEAPIFCLVEAKKQDIDGGVDQCAAQMLGAQRFNQREGKEMAAIYGCATIGEVWLFLKLQDNTVFIDNKRYFINELEKILGILQFIIDIALDTASKAQAPA
jgi:hypothetical protein